MRLVVLLGSMTCVIACSARPVATPASKVGAIDAWVIDAQGPVADAELRVVALAPMACPCPASDDEAGLGNEMPACACPAALARWRQRLASCAWPAPAIATLASDARGHVPLTAGALGKSVEATGGSGVTWLTLPARADRIGIELAASTHRRLRFDHDVAVKAALLFEDGHCVPLRRDDSTAWVTVAPVPKAEEWPVLVVEAPGFATIVRAWYEGDSELALPLHRAQPIAGTCAGDTVTVENAFQQLAVRVDASKRFRIDGALDVESAVTCTKGEDVVEEWTFSPADGLNESANVYGGLIGGGCHDVDVVDRAGRPIAGAEVSFMTSMGGGMSTGPSTTANERGRACVDDVHAGGELVVNAPLDRGGQCAGEVRLPVTQQHLARPIRVTLDVRKLARSRWRGRVLSPEKIPVAGAYVSVRDIAPSAAPECSERGDASVKTAADGSFELPALPHGSALLAIQHDWYTEGAFSITVPGAERELVLDRGMTWRGRVLDPDGKVIDRCALFVTLADQRLLTAQCSPRGFELTTLVPGKTKVSVRVEKHALGTFRTLERTVELATGAPLRDDVRWPAGDSIAGRVVDASGAPIAGARLTALPKGTVDRVDRFDADEVMLEADVDGRFTFRHLRPGTWVVRGDRRASQQTTVEIKTPATDVRIVTAR